MVLTYTINVYTVDNRANITFSVSAEIDEPDTVCIDGGISTETLESLQRTANKVRRSNELLGSKAMY